MDTEGTRIMTIPRMTAGPEHATLAQAAQRAVAYALVTLPMFALWELAHARLYTIWVEGGPDAAWRAALHCTLGDAAIAFACVMATTILARPIPWLRRAEHADAVIVAMGVLTTIVIEWISTRWLGRWTYRESMPLVPLVGIGLSPLAQWVVIPLIAIRILQRRGESALPR